MEENGIWIEKWKVPAFMVDVNQRIRHRAIADIFQELANNHANFRKVGFEDMKKNGKFWVLNRQSIHIDEWPQWEQSVTVESWISMMKGPFSLRNFTLFNERGNTLIRASYLWTSIDRQSMLPVAFPAGEFPIIASRDFELPEAHKFLIKSASFESSFSLTVRDSDLDIIGHTNNAVYLQWAVDILSTEEKSFRQIDANYVGESFLDDTIQINKIVDNNQVLVSLKLDNGKEISRFKFLR